MPSRMKLPIKALLLLAYLHLALTVPAYSADLPLRIYGTSVLSEDVVRRAVEKVEKPYDQHLEQVVEAIEELYAGKGYLGAEVEVTLSSGFLQLDIDEGPLFVVDRVEVVGAEGIPPSKVADLVGMDKGDVIIPSVVEAGLEVLRGEYYSKGYLFAGVVWSFTPGPNVGGKAYSVLMVEVDEGLPTLVGSVQIVGNFALTNMEVRNFLALYSGGRLDGERLADGLLRLQQEYENRGYPLVEIELGGFTMEKGSTIGFTINIDEGRMVKLKEIEISGNNKTRMDVILREVTLKVGDLYVQREVEETLRRLRRLKLFPKDPQITLEGDRLVIEITEGRYIRLGGAFGYQPRREELSQRSRYVGRADISLLNIAGTARRLSLHWSGQSEGATEASLKYKEPWLFGYPVYLDLGLGYRKQDEFRRMQGSLGLGTFIRGTYQLEVGGGFSKVTGYTMASSNKGFIYFLEGIDTTDRPFNPTTGWEILARQEVGIKSVFAFGTQPSSRMKLPKLEASLWRYLGLGGRMVLAGGIEGRAVLFGEGERYLDEIYYLGGSAGLRGYRDEQFRGEQVGLATVELRFLVADWQYLFLFADGGYYFLGGDGGAKGYKLGFGGGLVARTPIGVLGLEYGIGEGGFGGGVIRVSMEGEM